MGSTKQAWARPELVVLVRSRPEEAVLVTCKFGGASGPIVGSQSCQQSGAPCDIRAKS